MMERRIRGCEQKLLADFSRCRACKPSLPARATGLHQTCRGDQHTRHGNAVRGIDDVVQKAALRGGMPMSLMTEQCSGKTDEGGKTNHSMFQSHGIHDLWLFQKTGHTVLDDLLARLAVIPREIAVGTTIRSYSADRHCDCFRMSLQGDWLSRAAVGLRK